MTIGIFFKALFFLVLTIVILSVAATLAWVEVRSGHGAAYGAGIATSGAVMTSFSTFQRFVELFK